jgi:hypothetical protein
MLGVFFILSHIKEGVAKPEYRHPDAFSRILSRGSGLRAIALNPFPGTLGAPMVLFQQQHFLGLNKVLSAGTGSIYTINIKSTTQLRSIKDI